jgi:hypothetical protein
MIRVSEPYVDLFGCGLSEQMEFVGLTGRGFSERITLKIFYRNVHTKLLLLVEMPGVHCEEPTTESLPSQPMHGI